MRAAAALRTVEIEGHVPELTRQPVPSAYEAATTHDPHANTFGNSNDDEIARSLSVTEPDFCKSACVGSIFHLDRKACSPLQRAAQIELRPVQVRSKDDTLLKAV